jgi:catechol 2,3-dioxygenase-like lactoylglutathione lyase family enzyme
MDLNQVTLATNVFEDSVAFYQKLGLTLIVLAEGRYARFELPEGQATLSLHATETPATGSTVLYFEVEDVDQRYSELNDAGIVFDTPPTSEPWLWREARFRDPGGAQLCLFTAGENRLSPPWRLTT